MEIFTVAKAYIGDIFFHGLGSHIDAILTSVLSNSAVALWSILQGTHINSLVSREKAFAMVDCGRGESSLSGVDEDKVIGDRSKGQAGMDASVGTVVSVQNLVWWAEPWNKVCHHSGGVPGDGHSRAGCCRPTNRIQTL